MVCCGVMVCVVAVDGVIVAMRGFIFGVMCSLCVCLVCVHFDGGWCIGIVSECVALEFLFVGLWCDVWCCGVGIL